VEASTGRALAALLFITYALAALDAFSSVHSSPYTAEVRGGSAENDERVRRYARTSVYVGIGLGAAGTAISGKAWPFFGAVVACGFMYVLYDRALKNAADCADSETSLG
jgi:hypothetical protein